MSIPGAASPLFLATTGAAAAFEISRSLRFDSSASSFLNRTPSSASNRKTWTWSGWVKRSALSSLQMLFEAKQDGNDYTALYFTTSDTFEFEDYSGNSLQSAVITSQVFRDCSSWYHIVVAVDTTQPTSSNRTKIYINGSQVSGFGTATYITQNNDTYANSTQQHRIGGGQASNQYFDGCLAEVNLIDGSALDPTSFGAFDDNGVWQAKDTSGLTFGTNGFRLKFDDNSSNTALGNDSSGNDNDWTVNNLSTGASAWNQSQTWSSSTGITDPDSTRSSAHIFNGVITGNQGSAEMRPYNATVTLANSVVANSSIRFYGAFENPTNVRYKVNSTTTDATPPAYVDNFTFQWAQVTNVSFPVTISSVGVTGGNVGNGGRFVAIEVDGKLLVDSGISDPLAAGTDSLVDTPTNGTQTDTGVGNEVVGNYATLNPLFGPNGLTLTNGSLNASNNAESYKAAAGTIGVSSGKWYWEVTCTSTGYVTSIGITSNLSSYGVTAAGTVTYHYDGTRYTPGGSSYGDAYSSGDVLGFALDMDSGSLECFKNNVSQGNIVTGLTGTYFPWLTLYGSHNVDVNFGQRAFAYAAPSGYKCLTSSNLSSTIADGSLYFDTFLYTGDGASSRNLTLPLAADLLWIKKRSAAQSHQLADTVRGDNAVLRTNGTIEERNPQTAYTGGGISSISGTTATLSSGTSSNDNLNANNSTLVGWAWDAGTSTVSNTDGTITSQVRANPSAGFSIVSWTGNSTAGATLGHSLSTDPKMIIVKNRSRGTYGDWVIGHDAINGFQDGNQLYFTAAGVASGEGFFNNTSPTSSVFTVKNNYQVNYAGDNYIAYCFAPVEGYSAFGTVFATGSSDGGFAYTGFRPRFLLYKNADLATGNWAIYDSERDPDNPSEELLFPNLSNAELTFAEFDLLSNGIKLRYNYTSGQRVVFAAFAEHPFASNGGLAR